MLCPKTISSKIYIEAIGTQKSKSIEISCEKSAARGSVLFSGNNIGTGNQVQRHVIPVGLILDSIVLCPQV